MVIVACGTSESDTRFDRSGSKGKMRCIGRKTRATSICTLFEYLISDEEGSHDLHAFGLRIRDTCCRPRYMLFSRY